MNLKAINPGLGLDHFKDGLPYTPDQVRRRELAKKIQAKLDARVETRTIQTERPMVQYNAPELRQREETPESIALKMFNAEAGFETFETASRFRRVFAYAFDSSMTMMLFWGIAWAAFRMNGYELGAALASRDGVSMLWPLVLLYFTIHLGYFMMLETTFKRTLGKALFGISIRSESTFATLGRAMLFFLSAAPLGLGLLPSLFDSKKRCWHDLITGSEVVAS